ncbi:hypothetical protein FACS1894170_00050 [Planctomycetales bacterium]|nr:hypothetical protein FACS1894170_00050 [Planctomycetales bacterium]
MKAMTKPKPGKFNFVLEVSVCFMLIVAVYCGWSFWYYGDCCKGWQYINGVRLSVGSNKLDFGEIMVGESKTGFFKLHNLSGKPVVVLGAEVGCGCLTTTELPLVIQPYQRVDFALTLQPGENQIGKLEQVVLLNLNVEQPTKLLKVKAAVKSKL